MKFSHAKEKTRNSTAILGAYDSQCTLYGQFEKVIYSLLIDLLKQYKIRVHSATTRLKTRPSLETKLAKEGSKYHTTSDIMDIIGARIITYFPDEVDSVSSLIKNEFRVNAKHSVDKRALIDPDRFGYISVHYIVKLNPSRLALTEYRRFADCQAEIQVRSLLQHAWAEIEHDLGYKNEQAVPRQIKRRFSRLAGLLELADDEFMNIRNQIRTTETNLARKIQEYPSQVRINKESILIYLKNDKLIHQINGEIERATHNILAESNSSAVNETIRRLRYLGLETIADVDSALKKHHKLIFRIINKLVEPTTEANTGFYTTDIAIFFLCYALIAAEGSKEKIDAFILKFFLYPDEEFATSLFSLGKSF